MDATLARRPGLEGAEEIIGMLREFKNSFE